MRGEGATRSKKALAAASGMYGVNHNRASRLARWMTALAKASDLHASYRKSNIPCTVLRSTEKLPQKARVNTNHARVR